MNEKQPNRRDELVKFGHYLNSLQNLAASFVFELEVAQDQMREVPFKMLTEAFQNLLDGKSDQFHARITITDAQGIRSIEKTFVRSDAHDK